MGLLNALLRGITNPQARHRGEGTFKNRLIIIGVVPCNSYSQEVYSFLCTFMLQQNPNYIVTSTNILTEQEALLRGIPIKRGVNKPQFLVFNNPYDNFIDYTKIVYRTESPKNLQLYIYPILL